MGEGGKEARQVAGTRLQQQKKLDYFARQFREMENHDRMHYIPHDDAIACDTFISPTGGSALAVAPIKTSLRDGTWNA